MEIRDIILAVLIIGVPIYIFMSNKNSDPSNQTIIDKIKAIFTGDKNSLRNSIPNYRINDSAISSVNYERIITIPEGNYTIELIVILLLILLEIKEKLLAKILHIINLNTFLKIL